MNTDRNHYDEMFDDLYHLLRWLSIGQMAVAVILTLEVIAAVTEGRWFSAPIFAAAAVVFYVAQYRTQSRGRAYRIALNWWEAQRAKEQGR